MFRVGVCVAGCWNDLLQNYIIKLGMVVYMLIKEVFFWKYRIFMINWDKSYKY